MEKKKKKELFITAWSKISRHVIIFWSSYHFVTDPGWWNSTPALIPWA